ncbi:patatin-like phospholipase family protein [Curtobacterium sp. MCBD17_021]|uniref:patatin-like phospholipase family protein n=1 Tax=Curtobacterium sp. MCBD17_021 TaxID=2175665 RepID=UPI000DA9B2D8|nr:patatin-like phospholipase family protein [Curtobacterium sp. MCBD17_021]PZE68983.1 phospholipase [Curtobacterium sp. MCBD17_021]
MTDVATPPPTPGTRAVVLGGGGVAGIAWELGVLSALEDAGADLGAADLVVGTSAGSVVGAFLRAGGVRGAYEQQLSPLPTTYEEPAPVDVTAVEQRFAAALQGATSEQDARARIGAAAQEVTGGQSDDERVATFRETLPTAEWPDRPYAVTAVDAVDGSFRVLRAEDGVPLERAVAASCSVPMVWSPVRIDGHPYVDGGARSATNADVAAGYERVLVIACSPEGPSPLGPWLDRAVATLRDGGSQVEVLVADEASQRAFGTNSLALSTQRPAAEAGRAQAERVADRIVAFWC